MDVLGELGTWRVFGRANGKEETLQSYRAPSLKHFCAVPTLQLTHDLQRTLKWTGIAGLITPI